LAFKVIELGGNRELVNDFLSVINSNLGLISHHYWNTATYWLKFANFSYPVWNYSLPGSRWRMLGDSSLHCFCLIHLCDRQTDGWTDRQNCDG